MRTMSFDEALRILKKSLENDYGDWGRTEYLIKRFQNNQEIFESDKKYIQRLAAMLLSNEKRTQREPKVRVLEEPIITSDLIR